jgi:hypothetical protein
MSTSTCYTLGLDIPPYMLVTKSNLQASVYLGKILKLSLSNLILPFYI